MQRVAVPVMNAAHVESLLHQSKRPLPRLLIGVIFANQFVHLLRYKCADGGGLLGSENLRFADRLAVQADGQILFLVRYRHRHEKYLCTYYTCNMPKQVWLRLARSRG